MKHWKSGTLHKTKSVMITEGPMKADLIADLLPQRLNKEEIAKVGTTVLAIPCKCMENRYASIKRYGRRKCILSIRC